MKPMVSVIIPTFNRKASLLRALSSVMQQTYRPLEVIVVDDCSTDGTADLIDPAQYPVRVRLLRSSVNLGPAAARNKGINAAVGKYIALLDSDDHWLPTKIAHQVDAAERHPHRDALVVYTQAEIRRRNETIIRPMREIGEKEAIADYLFANGGYMAQPTVLVSTAIARSVLYRPELRLHEDWDWYIRLQQHGVKFVMVPQCLCIIDDRETELRASKAKPERSLAALQTWKPVISRRAYLALRAKIAPQLRQTAPLRAAAMIMAAYLGGAISTWFLFVLLGRLVHPGLREIAYAVRHRLAHRGRPHTAALRPPGS